MPPPVPGTEMPRTFFGFLPRRLPRTAPPIRPAAPVAIPATTAAFEPPPFCFCDEEERLLADEGRLLADDDRLLEALVFAAALRFAVVPERGLLLEALLLFAPLLLFEALERRAVPLEPLELCELFFCRLDEPVFACAISPPWVSDSFGLENAYPDRIGRNAMGQARMTPPKSQTSEGV